jgi:hypothetical protein
MTPKEKAKELFDLFHFPHFYGNSQWHDIDEEHTYEVQKKCALIAVDEILNYCSDVYDKEFMEQVKAEIIENL